MSQKLLNIWSENMNIKRIKIDGFKNLKDILLNLDEPTYTPFLQNIKFKRY